MGVSDFISQCNPPAPTWTVDDIPDLAGRVMIVTGANTGVGKETVKALLAKNCKVYVAARSEEKAKEAIADLKKATGQEGVLLKLDLSDLASVKSAAQEFLSKETRLDALFNNAGVMVPPKDQLTKQGYDLQWGTNVLGHFYFTELLIPVMLETTKLSPDNTARVCFTSSLAHERAKKLDFDPFTQGPARDRMATQTLYAHSKLGSILVARQFARRYGDQGLVSTAANPGNLKSDLQRHLGSISRSIVNMMLHPVEMGALTQLYCNTAPEAKNAGGQYFWPWARPGKSTALAEDEQLGEQVWNWSEEEIKKFEEAQ